MQENLTPAPYHVPALLKEAIEGLKIKENGIYVDATFGGGGHSRAILELLGPEGRLIGFDQDSDAMANIPDNENFKFVRSNFEFIPNFLKFYGIGKVDGILADLGVSSHHFDDPRRGFSFRADAPLDMRMNKDSELTAATLLNKASEEDLISYLSRGSDLTYRNKKNIAEAIIRKRAVGPILTTADLLEAVRPVLNPKNEKKDLAQIFQSIRIIVNNELEVLENFLKNAGKTLHPGGRLAVITYHSLEDRLVKNLMKTGNIDGVEDKDFYGRSHSPWRLITRSPITPTPEEVEANPRSRSAKLRIAELTDEQ